MATIKSNKPDAPTPFQDNDGLQVIFIDPKVDVFKAQAVIGPAPMEFYHDKIIKDLVEQAIKNMKPELIEKPGYEIMKYEIIIKQRKVASDA